MNGICDWMLGAERMNGSCWRPAIVIQSYESEDHKPMNRELCREHADELARIHGYHAGRSTT